ncbi:TonB-dependent receptor [Dysgonomonadaceae bacterium zrk40]|nr:TonB-dependent receptor [Dysgonomonadaceae bacterium zrk40]
MRREGSLLLISLVVAMNTLSQERRYQETDSTIRLNEVIVNAYQLNTRHHQLPGSISLLTTEEMERGDGNSFAHTLHAMPGIYMHSGTYATSRIVIRGVGSRTPYNTNRIKAYLNDIPITSSDGISTPEDIDLTGIARMEVIKGPASALYGSGLGGNINLYTPQGGGEGGSALLQYGSFNTMKAAAGGNMHRNNLQIGGQVSHLRSDGHREHNRLRRTTLLSSGSWRQPSWSLGYTLLLIDMNAQIPSSIGKTLYETSPESAAANWKAIEGYKEYRRAIAGITLTNRLAENWSNRLTLFGNHTDSYERRPFNNLEDGTRGGGIRNRLSYHAERFDALLGMEWISDSYRWQLDLEGEQINRNRERRSHLNLFAMTYWRPAPAWNISLGGAVNSIRYRLTDLFPENGDQSGNRYFPAIFSPRLGINYAPSPRLALFASAGHGFSMPSPEETLLPEGEINRDIQPEQGMQYETGIRLNLFKGITRLEATLYRIDLRNLLVTKRITEDIFTGINAGKTRHSGLELMLQQQLFRLRSFPGSLQLNASYTLSENRFVDFEEEGINYNDKQLPGIPAAMAQVTLLWQPTKSWMLELQMQQVGKQFIDDANSVVNDAYMLTGIKATRHLDLRTTGSVALYAGINNLTNSRYAPMLTVNAVAFGNNEPRYYYPGMPRHLYAGIRWSF